MKDQIKEIPMELKESVHKIWLAGIGALALAEEEGSKLFKDLVEKGQKFEGKSKATKQKMVGGFDQMKNRFGGLFEKFEDALNNGISLGLNKVGVPTKEEIELLTKRVEELMNSVDGLKISEPAAVAAKPAKKVETKPAAAKKTRTTRTTRTRRTAVKS